MMTQEKTLLKRADIGAAGLAGLNATVEKLNRRAERYGMNMLTVTVVREYTTVDEETGRTDVRYEVDIEGCAPCIDGWYLAARIENNEVIGTVVRVVPGKFADCDYSTYRDHDYSCDHCNTRRRRNDVFVLKNDDGESMVVGRNCLADFLRCEDASAFAEYAAWIDMLTGMTSADFDDIGYEGGYGGRATAATECLVRYLTAVRMITRRIGWMSRTAARDQDCSSTADNTNFYLYGRGRAHRDFIVRNELYVCDEDKERAEAAIEWAKSLSPAETGRSEYLDVIHRIAEAGLVGDGLDGYAASILRAKENADERAAERAERESVAKEKDYIGSKGERLRDVPVTIKRVRYYEGNYGVKTIVAMEASLPGGKVAPIVWFASGEHDYDEGAEYLLTGTVKKHEEDSRFGKQTSVNRCKLENSAK